jgi:1-acyl-sn-glycerol-3-phosphate acyltransferase
VIRSLFNALAIGVLTAVWSVLALLALPLGATFVLKLARIWSRQILFACGVKVRALPPPEPLDAPSYLVLSNHTSHFDALSIYSTLPIEGLRPVAKRELGYIPLFGWVLALGAAIMIDRGDQAKAKASIDRAGAVIRGGRSVLMFPEGTRTPQGELGPLKKGPFYLATAARVPILPIALHGTGEVMRSGDWQIHPGNVVLCIGAPIPTEGRGEGEEARSSLMMDVEHALRDLMELARKSA